MCQIIDNHNLLTQDQIYLLSQILNVQFQLGGFISLEDIISSLGIDIIIETGIVKSTVPYNFDDIEDSLSSKAKEIEDIFDKIRKLRDLLYSKGVDFDSVDMRICNEMPELHKYNNMVEVLVDLGNKLTQIMNKLFAIRTEKDILSQSLTRGLYCPDSKKIILYPEEMAQEYNGNNMDELIVSTLAHEIMHAYFNRPGHNTFKYVFCVEEPLAEFGMMMYLWETNSQYFNWAYDDVKNKKNCYRYGALLYNQYQQELPNSATRKYLEDYKIPLDIDEVLEHHGGGTYISLPTCADNIITYTTIDNSILDISFYHNTVISNTYDNNIGIIVFNNPLTSIEDSAFCDCSGLTSITIPDSVTSIGEYAFCVCSGLTSITIPESVTSIGDSAFVGCSGLTSVTVSANNVSFISIDNCLIERATNKLVLGCQNSIIPYSVTSIGDFAFCDCSGLTSITIPDSVTSIGDFAFCDCSGLTSITIPDSVTSIGEYAFCVCSGLTSITIPESVTSIGYSAFVGCSGLTSITVSANNVSFISIDNCLIERETNKLVLGCQNSIIPYSVTSIGDCAFRDCSGLTSITIPDSVTSIGYWAFCDCSGLTSITIPESVTSIGEAAFYGCNSLTSITIPDSVTSIGGEAFYGVTSVIKK